MRILLVEDSPSDRQILKYLLEAQFKNGVKFFEAGTLKRALELLDLEPIDCIILDLHLPDSLGKETFQKLNNFFPTIPIIIMTNNKDRDMALQMIKDGAADFVLKNYTDEEDIFRRIIFAVEKHKNSVRVPSEKAASFKKVSQSSMRLKKAQDDDASISTIRNFQVETTYAMADLTSKMFEQLQAINIQLTSYGEQQKTIAKTVESLDTELLKGYPNRLSIKSKIDLLEVRFEKTENKIETLSKDINDTKRTNTDLKKTKMDLRAKVVIALISLTGILATTLIGYYTSSSRRAEPKQITP